MAQRMTRRAQRAVIPADVPVLLVNGTASSPQHYAGPLATLQLQHKMRAGSVEAVRRRLEAQIGVAFQPIEPAIAQDYRVWRQALRRSAAALWPLLPAHLEYVGEIGGKLQANRDDMRLQIEIPHQQQFIVGVPPDELPPVDIDQLAMQHLAIPVHRVGIGKIDGQQRIVLAGIGAEQQRLVAVEAQLQLRQIAGVVVIETVGAAAAAGNIAKWIEDDERVAMLQDPAARLAKPAGRLDAVLGIVVAALYRRCCHDAAPARGAQSAACATPSTAGNRGRSDSIALGALLSTR